MACLAGAFSFQIGPVIDDITELNAHVTSPSTVMNANSSDRLPPTSRS